MNVMMSVRHVSYHQQLRSDFVNIVVYTIYSLKTHNKS